MSSEGSGSVTRWLGQLQAGDESAAQNLWERYFRRLVGLARTKLQGLPRGAADEEDVALSAFHSFCRGAEDGLFPQLRDRKNLWRLLVTLTLRKTQHMVRDEHRQKRGGGKVKAESARQGTDDSAEMETALEQLLDREPSPDLAAQLAEDCQRLLGSLGNAELRTIALWKMAGENNLQIAVKLGCSLSTVERRLALIRKLWEEESS
jgi:DNA-directed RNA polymerase specialized sigma24 family protein